MADETFIEVYELKDGQGRPGFAYKDGALAFLQGELPNIGDIIFLSKDVTGDSEEQAYYMGGLAAPFRVVERELMYVAGAPVPNSIPSCKRGVFRKAWIHVKRLSEDEYEADPGVK